jgi:hypothetical protein
MEDGRREILLEKAETFRRKINFKMPLGET